MTRICKKDLKFIEEIKSKISKEIINLEDMRLTQFGLMVIAYNSIVDTYYIRNATWLSEKELKIKMKLKHTPKIKLGLQNIEFCLKNSSIWKSEFLFKYKKILKIEIYNRICEIIKNDYKMIINVLEIPDEEKIGNVHFVCVEKKGKTYFGILIDIKFEKEVCIDCSTYKKIKITDYVCKEIYFQSFFKVVSN